ncbi:MAG: transglycosylase SLT domain-containing protein [candidate division WOR-3 bacterium]
MIINYCRKSFLIFLLFFISCPQPGTKEIVIEHLPDQELILEAAHLASLKPLYAFELLKRVKNSRYTNDKLKILLKIYLDQREYLRASALLDSLSAEIDLKGDSTLKDLALKIFLREKRWEKVLDLTEDSLLKGVALFRLEKYEEAINFLARAKELSDYSQLFTAQCYYQLKDLQNALITLLSIDSVSSVLAADYQRLLFDLLLNTPNISLIERAMARIKDNASRKFLRLKISERQGERQRFQRLARDLIKNHPSSFGAKYCITVLKPKDKEEYKEFGKVAFLHNDYPRAVKFLERAVRDSDVNYYLGKIYYDQRNYNTALNYLLKSRRAEAYYYRALIFENRQEYTTAIAVYDSLINQYPSTQHAIKALKRKAFLLEDLGDTLGAVATFIKVREKTTNFRAGFQLFRIGRLTEALAILSRYDEPDFIYWQVRIRERLGQPVDSLKNYLLTKYPLSYYSLLKNGGLIPMDTVSLTGWLQKFGDTTVTFDSVDSIHIKRALRYFAIGENNYALAELNAITDRSLSDLIALCRICSANGDDYGAIRFALEVKKWLEYNNSFRNFPVDFLRLLYPVRYLFTIAENSNDIWLALAMIWQESMFNPEARSRADAQGLMQIIPSTGRLIARELGITDYSLYNPTISIRFGTYYFNKMLNEFNYLPLALAAYNAGPINLRRWLTKNPNAEMDEFIELIPFSETRDYVRLTMARRMIYQKIWGDLLE